LGYYPNRDAITFFCSEILQLVQDRCSTAVEVVVIGSGSGSSYRQPSLPGVHFIGSVPETTPFYADCDAVIVPLRVGGGTRIKILEAFSHQRAVVSTSLGAEGLALRSGTHIIVADGAEAFAEQCLTLIENKDVCRAIAHQGHQFFKEHHTLPALEKLVGELFGA
jgi:glycosyltransferase involved in cell wall biosynthesis